MNTVVKIQITGYDKPVVFSDLVLSQPVNEHHTFQFVWNVGSFKTNPKFQLEVIKNYLGEELTIEISPSNIFKGLITEISVDEQSNSSHSFSISGKSPTILLDDASRSTSYLKSKLEDVVKKSITGVQGNLLKTTIDPVNKNEIHYLVQYNETDFEFLRRIAKRFGEWFYFDGVNMVFGPPGQSDLTLHSGQDLDRFITQLNALPSKFSFKSWDAFKGEPIANTLGQVDPLRNSFAEAALDKADKLFGRQDDRTRHVYNVVNKNQLDELIKKEKESISASIITVKGESKNPDLKTGCIFNVENQGGKIEYVATSVVHYSNLAGHYTNSFIAVPSSAKVPPYTDPFVNRKAGMQSATVKENHDSDGINRIKVQFHWQKGNETSPWIRMGTPHGGGGKGMMVLPEKGEEVTIDFEGGDVDKPIAINALYNGKAKSGSGDADNNTKGFSTRSGCKVLVDDKAGSVTINDKTGNNKIFIDGAGKISIDSTDSITLTGGNSVKLVSGSGTIEIKNDGTIDITGSKITVNGSDFVHALSGPASFSAEKSGDAVMAGTKSTVSGTAEVTVTGAKATLNGDATTDVSSMGPTSLSGAILKLN